MTFESRVMSHDLRVSALCSRSPFISILTIILTISRDSIHYVQALNFFVMSHVS